MTAPGSVREGRKVEQTSRMRRPLSRAVSLLVVIAMLASIAVNAAPSGSVRAQAAQTWSAAALAPADAPIFLAVSLDMEGPQWSAAREVLARLGMDAAFDEVIADALREFNVPTGTDPQARPRGLEVAVVVTNGDAFMQEAPSDPAGFVVVIHADDIGPWETGLRQTLQESADEMGGQVTQELYNGVAITTAMPGEAALARVGEALVLGGTAADIHPVIDVYRGDRPALTTTEAWTALQPELPGESLLFGYVDGTIFLGAAREEIVRNEQLRPAGVDIMRLLDGQIAFSLSAMADGLRLDTLVTHEASGDAASPVGGATLGLDASVPADTVLFVNGRDIGQNQIVGLVALLFASGVAEGFGGFAPFGTEASPREPAEIYARVARVLGFNPRTDVLDQLVGEYGLAVTADGLDPNGLDGIFVSDVGNAVRVADAVSKMAVLINAGLSSSGMGLGLQTREVEGGLLQVLDVPVPDRPVTVHLEFGVVGGQLVVGYGSGLSDYQSGTAGSLADNPRYQAAVQGLPEERDWIVYVDLARLSELAIEAGMTEAMQMPVSEGQPSSSSAESLAVAGYSRGERQGATLILRVPEAEAVGTPTASPAAAPAASGA